MSIMQKIFGAAAPAQQPQAQVPNAAPAVPATPGQMPAQNTNPAVAGNPTAPAATVNATTADPANPLSQMDQFKDLFNNDPNAKKPVEGIFEGVTLEKMQEAAKKNDFSQVVTPELAAVIQAGGPEAMQAMQQVMAGMAQKSFGDSAFATTKMIEQALAKQQERFMAELPNIIKSQTVSENLRTTNPLFNHPAAAPMLEAMKQQLMVKYPQASAAELQSKAQEYLVSFAAAANPTKPDLKNTSGNSSEPDWEDFLK